MELGGSCVGLRASHSGLESGTGLGCPTWSGDGLVWGWGCLAWG